MLIYYSGWLGPSVLDDVTEDIAIKTKDNKISIVSPKVSVSQQQLWLQIEPQMSRSPPGKPSFEVIQVFFPKFCFFPLIFD